MSYSYEDLDDKQFERLVVQCMRKLFGPGVQAFAAGRDGGRDALFEGTAERFPSTASPWEGTTVGQAKHTLGTNRHFSEPSFGGAADSSAISEELLRIKKLAGNGELTNYILFSNRRLGGVFGPELTARIAEEANIAKERVFLVGIEHLDDLLKEFPEVVALANIDPVDGPLLVSSADLAELILAIGDELGTPTSFAEPVDRVSFEAKNAINSMTPEFADELSRRYMGRTKQIEEFLADPGNAEHLARYEAAVEDFQLKIIAKRQSHQTFDEVFNHLVEVLVSRDGVLARRPSLVRAMLFYMYWHCDIGMGVDAASK
jgi:C-terminal domain 12 of the ABC-three component (ABC-3C) systems